jgi:hypothetical protein
MLSNQNTIGMNSTSICTSNKRKNSNTISPSEAKKKHKMLLRQGKKLIGSNKSKSKVAALLEAEQGDRNFMMQSQKDKIVFETKKHNKLKAIETKKLGIEERFKLDEQQMLAHSEIDKQKLLLVRMEVFEKKEQMKRNNPHINKSEINRRFNL